MRAQSPVSARLGKLTVGRSGRRRSHRRLSSVRTAAAAAVALAGSLALTGTAVAGTSPATARAKAGGKTNIFMYSINSDGAYFQAVVSGAIGDYGTAVSVYPDGKVDPEHNSEMEVELAHGSFRLEIAGLDKMLVEQASHEPIYPATCSDFFRLSVPVPIVAGSGTGSYRGIAGTFAMTLTGDEVQVTPCTQQLTMLKQVVVVDGSGTVAF
jgi:hypothetical protein